METDTIYLAGFFDGEGYIGILKRTRGKYIEHFVQLSIGQKDGATLDWIKDNFGGNVYFVKRDGSYYWTSSNKNAYAVLKKMLPYLKYKKPQAEMAIEFFEGRPKKRRVTPKELARREQISARLKSLKREFRKSNYCVSVRRNND